MVDDHSHDNCGIEYLLVRRADWQEDWAEYCDSIAFYLSNPTQDSIWEKFLESDFTLNEFESYYADVLGEFVLGSSIAGSLVNEAWHYDLRRHATVDCLGKMTLEEFNTLYAELHPDLDLAILSAIGGGWAPKAPFTCEDACQVVKVELLAVDSSGNWSIGWSDVLVEDKMDPTIAQSLTENVSMSCTAYNQDQSYHLPGIEVGVTLAEIVTMAIANNADALGLLDSLFGGYQVGYLSGPNYIDVDGDVISDVVFTDRGGCKCEEELRSITYYDFLTEDFETVDSMVTVCSLDTADLPQIQNGVVTANCVQNTKVLQNVSADISDCGGTITRTFTITNTCAGASPVGVTKSQTITIGDTCSISKWLFDLPADTIIYACKPEFDSENNLIGSADPDLIGRPEYLFDPNCRIVGIAREDLVTSLTGDGGCSLVRRTWYFGDWCVDTESEEWWRDNAVVADSFTQIIVIADTLDPECHLEVMGKDENGVVTLNSCDDGVLFSFEAFDACSLKLVTYIIERLVDGGPNVHVNRIDEIPMPEDAVMYFDSKILNIGEPGRYRAITTATDLCGNDSTCIDSFTLDCSLSRQSGLADIGMDHMPVGKAPLVMDDVIDASSPIILDKSHSTGGEGFELYQNRPNPFSNFTVVGFDLPEEDEIRLSVFDTKGQRLKTVKARYTKGHHEIELDFGTSNVAGVLYYQLDTKRFSATRRMIVTP